jgi:hypothetical protein
MTSVKMLTTHVLVVVFWKALWANCVEPVKQVPGGVTFSILMRSCVSMTQVTWDLMPVAVVKSCLEFRASPAVPVTVVSWFVTPSSTRSIVLVMMLKLPLISVVVVVYLRTDWESPVVPVA